MSKKMWRRFLYPGFKKFIEISHSFGVPVMHHTCGGIYEIIPDMIEAGLEYITKVPVRVKGAISECWSK